MSPLVPAPVRALLALPGALPFALAALLGRLSFGTVGLALLLVVEGASGSYALAGSALVAHGLAAALLAPPRARLVDRHGRRRVLPLLAGAEGAVLVGLALGAAALPPALLVGLCGAAGCLVPPLGPTTRAVWAEATDGPEALRAAYSLDTVAEEGLFTVGPLLVAAVVAVADPRAALLLTAALLVAGTLALVRSPLAARPSRAAPPGPVLPGHVLPARPLRAPAFRRLLLVLLGAGVGLGGVELAVVAVADAQGSAASAGVLLAALGLGSAVGGGVYGLRAWQRGAGAHLVVLLAGLATGLAALAVAAALGRLLLVGAVLLAAGLAVAPLLVAAYTRADELSGPGSRTEAGTLVGTVNNLGTAVGTGATGLLLDARGPTAALVAGSVVLALTALVAARSGADVTPGG